MALYWKLRTIEDERHRIHVGERIKALRAQLKRDVTDKTSEHDLRLATWNIMHFGGSGGYHRETDALLYISEIIDHFDLVAVQEVKADLTQLNDLCKNYLGPEWDYIVTDTTGGRLGNDERMAFLYRKGKVRFSKLAGEIVLEDGNTIVGNSGIANVEFFKGHKQFARSPFVVGFECGWFTFKLCTVHIYFGNPKRPEGMPLGSEWDQLKADFMTIRQSEIRDLAEFMAKRQKAERRAELKNLRAKGWDTMQSKANYILLGDFNVVSPEHQTMQALIESGFDVPPGMEDLHTNYAIKKAHYDQIVHRIADKRVSHRTSGAVDFRESVFRKEDADHYIDVVADPRVIGDGSRDRDGQVEYFNRYRFKHQVSDHQLLWTAFDVDLANKYIDGVLDEAEDAIS